MIHVMCGISGSGKTTLSNQLASEHDATLYCYDAMSRKEQPYKTRLLMHRRILRDLKNNKNVVCDDSHITIQSRIEVLRLLSSVECKKILHLMKTPLDTCVERAKTREGREGWKDIVEKQFEHYEEPTLEEGWDEIIYHEYVKE